MEYVNEEEKVLAAALDDGQRVLDLMESDVIEAESEVVLLEEALASAESKDKEAQTVLDMEVEKVLGETDAAAIELAEYLDQNE